MEWREIAGYEGRYVVSDEGDILSLPRKGRTAAKLLRHGVGHGGYHVVTLSDGNKVKCLGVAALVARAFHGERPEGLVIRHLDGNTDNNRSANLTYGTNIENHCDALRHGTKIGLSRDDVVNIRNRYDSGETVGAIARDYTFSYLSIYKAAKRFTWKDMT